MKRLWPWLIGGVILTVVVLLILLDPDHLAALGGISVGTLASEDLACIGAGLLAASGQISLPAAILASFVGIFIGDTLIYWLGYHFGRPILRHRWARWFLSKRSLNRAQHLFHAHGIWIILLTRFLPGTRTATYFTAGAVHAPPGPFLLVFALAAAVWTPLLVGLSFFVGKRLLELYEVYEAFALPALLLAGLSLYLIIHYGIPLFTWRGRRRLKGKWLRATRWEFWPVWQINWLTLLYVLYLGFIRYRCPTLCTAVNPGIPHGGFIGESKAAILEGLAGAGEALPPWGRVPERGSAEDRLAALETLMEELGLTYPVALKPDEGQRGAGVQLVRDREAARDWLSRTEGPVILQAYVGGNEYGVFYVRHPEEERGRIVSVTLKEQLEVTGDGTDTLETLIYKHSRAIALLDTFLDRFDEDLENVPPAGERIRLGELGTHALGSLFRDGGHLVTPDLVLAIERISRNFDGFYFGRYDIKAPDDQAFQAGIELRVIELNGLTSEPTHIYDPRHGLLHAWKTLMGQWRTAYQIADANRSRGARVTPFGELLREIVGGLLRQRS